MELNSQEIQSIIPHRYPFLLVDRITALEVGCYACGRKCVTANEMHFLGHFPSYPVMPGVLIIEAMAQVGAVAILSEEKFKGKLVFFAGINKARFKKQVIPGDVLEMRVDLTKIKGSIGIGEAKAYVDGKLACSAELTFAIQS